MRRKTASAIILIILVSIGAGMFVYYENSNFASSPSNSNTRKQGSSESTAISQPDSENSAPADANVVPDRTFLVDPSSTPIFTDVPDSELDHEALEGFLFARPIGAYRIVRVDSDILRTKIRESSDSPEFTIQLLDSEPLRLAAKAAAEHSKGWQSGIGSWTGTVVGDETSRATFIVAPDATVSGVVRTLKMGRLKIEPINGTPYHMVWQWDPNYERNLD